VVLLPWQDKDHLVASCHLAAAAAAAAAAVTAAAAAAAAMEAAEPEAVAAVAAAAPAHAAAPDSHCSEKPSEFYRPAAPLVNMGLMRLQQAGH